ncbi:MAG: YegS/Rv2252/BmrU family lipid kinase [Veillonellales bacterium]
MKQFLLVYNPLSGDAYFKYKLDEVVQQFQRRGCLVTPVRTERKEDTNSLVLLAKEISADGIIISGGDGTVHEVMNAMLELSIDVPVGIIPSGTSNDFATYLKLSRDLKQCAEVIARGEVRDVDIGMVNNKYFINVASAGLLTGVAHTADTLLKNTLGKVAYYLKGIEELPSFRALPMKITADGQVLEDDVFLFLVMNSGVVGSFPNLVPNAAIDDGKLDLLIVNRCRLPELMRLFICLLTGNHLNQKNVTYIQAREITIESPEDLDSDLDGELGPKLPLKIMAVSHRIRVFCSRSNAAK